MKHSILYAEDNDDIREVVSDLLTRFGYDVTAVENGAKALSLFRKRRFDLIITDILMPILDGNKLISELANYSDLPPILVLSSRVSDIKPNPIITQVGVKPILFENLRTLINKALQGRNIDWNMDSSS